MSLYSFLRPALATCALLALLLAPACQTPPPPPSASPLAALTYDGSQAAIESVDRDIAAAGQDSAKLAAISSRLIAILRTPAATGAARQAAAERLALFPASTLTAGENPALWLAMAKDERQINFVKLALDRAPGTAVDEIFLAALAAATPQTRLAFVQSIGNRRIAAAVPKLAPLLNDTDAALAAAAIKALGQIGTPASLSTLKSAPLPASPLVIEARLAAAHHLESASAIREFETILATPAAPANLRAAALHGLLLAAPEAAPPRILAALSGDDAALKPVVIEALASLPAKDLIPALENKLLAWDAATQSAVIAALGRHGDASAVPLVARAAQHSDPAIRTAAITALGQLPGTPEIAALLAGIALGTNADDAKLARQTLARLDGPGVAAAVVSGAATDTAARPAYIDALAARNMTEAVPQLLKMRSEPSVAARVAALGSLAELAPFSTQRAILDWTVAATDSAEQTRALRALAAITTRNPDALTRAKVIIDTIDRSPAAVSLRLLPVLPRIGGTAAAECAARLALRDEQALAAAATAALARWTDDAGLLPLVAVAEKTSSDAIRAAAVTGAIKYLERSRALSSENLRALVTRLLAATTEDAARSRLVYLLGRCTDDEALALIDKLAADPALAADAADAKLVSLSQRSGRPALRSSANPEQLRFLLDGRMGSTWNVPALATQWIELDYKSSRPFRQLVVDGGSNQYNYPEHLEVCVTDDPKQPGEAKASVAGQLGKNIIDLPAGTRGRYLLIRHSKERAESWWTVAEITVD